MRRLPVIIILLLVLCLAAGCQSPGPYSSVEGVTITLKSINAAFIKDAPRLGDHIEIRCAVHMSNTTGSRIPIKRWEYIFSGLELVIMNCHVTEIGRAGQFPFCGLSKRWRMVLDNQPEIIEYLPAGESEHALQFYLPADKCIDFKPGEEYIVNIVGEIPTEPGNIRMFSNIISFIVPKP